MSVHIWVCDLYGARNWEIRWFLWWRSGEATPGMSLQSIAIIFKSTGKFFSKHASWQMESKNTLYFIFVYLVLFWCWVLNLNPRTPWDKPSLSPHFSNITRSSSCDLSRTWFNSLLSVALGHLTRESPFALVDCWSGLGHLPWEFSAQVVVLTLSVSWRREGRAEVGCLNLPGPPLSCKRLTLYCDYPVT